MEGTTLPVHFHVLVQFLPGRSFFMNIRKCRLFSEFCQRLIAKIIALFRAMTLLFGIACLYFLKRRSAVQFLQDPKFISLSIRRMNSRSSTERPIMSSILYLLRMSISLFEFLGSSYLLINMICVCKSLPKRKPF